MTSHIVLHLPCSYLPWTTGGKEVFTHSLACSLQAAGWRNHVAFHQTTQYHEPTGKHEIEGIHVEVLPALTATRAEIYARRPKEVPGFAELLRQIKPDIVHFQDFSIGANLLHLDMARQGGAKIVMSYHTPGQSCLQHELRYAGKSICDGQILKDRCTSCRLGVQGISAWPRWWLSKFSLDLSGSSRWQRALSARAMTVRFLQAWRELVAKVDKIHFPAQWIVELMRLNEVPPEKLAFFRTGLPFERLVALQSVAKNPSAKLQVVMLGRCEPIKGQDVLIDAVLGLPSDVPLEISFLGPYWDSTAYGRACLEKMKHDARFRQPELAPHSNIPQRLLAADVLVVPSIWLETGPLVVLEAFAAGLPVVGSRLGGIAELVSHERNGLLFEPGNVAQLRELLQRLILEPELLQRLRQNITPFRTMREVALDTANLYESLLKQ